MNKAGCVLLLVSTVALAQTSSLAQQDLSRGATLPPTGAALVDEATAPIVNPAGLTSQSGLQALYIHDLSVPRRQTVDGLYLGTSLFNAVGLGLNVEWVRNAGFDDYRKTTWAMSFGGPQLSIGLGLNLFSARDFRPLDGLASLDVGVMSRPLRALSLGAAVKNVDAPARDGISLPRRFDFGVGLRPLGERLTLGLDYGFTQNAGIGNGALQLTAQAEVVHGVVVHAGVSRGLRSGDDVLFQLGLTLNTPYLGATYAYGNGNGGPEQVVQVRLSTGRYSTLAMPEGKVALLDLDDVLTESRGTLSLLGFGSAQDPYLALTEYLDLAARDPELKGIVLKISSLPGGGLGKADELRQAVLRLRRGGKKVIAVLLNAGDTEYFLASAADAIYAVPQALLAINGFEANLTFLGETFDKLGVHWDVARVGAYKNAPDQLTRSTASPEQKESVSAYLDTQVKSVETAVTQARHLTVQQLHAAQAVGLLTPARAKQLGLVDDVLDSKALEERLGQLVPRARYDATYTPERSERRWSSRRRIAVIPVLGDIAGGKSRQDPLGLTHIAGAETVVRGLRQAQEDPSVIAIVLRVDSGGGDGLASDLMYRAVLEAKEKKPVIASMGDVAASGGYYAAMGADTVYANPTTITGSIGVFVVKPALEGLANKLGVRQEQIKRGPLASLFDGYKPWTPEEQVAAQRWVDAFYDDFITEVARSRHLQKPQVDQVARGRVWSGEDALAKGLVDHMGGLLDAMDEARVRGKAGVREELDFVVYGGPHGPFASLGGEEGVMAKLIQSQTNSVIPETFKRLASELGLQSLTWTTPGVQARMPFVMNVR